MRAMSPAARLIGSVKSFTFPGGGVGIVALATEVVVVMIVVYDLLSPLGLNAVVTGTEAVVMLESRVDTELRSQYSLSIGVTSGPTVAAQLLRQYAVIESRISIEAVILAQMHSEGSSRGQPCSATKVLEGWTAQEVRQGLNAKAVVYASVFSIGNSSFYRSLAMKLFIHRRIRTPAANAKKSVIKSSDMLV